MYKFSIILILGVLACNQSTKTEPVSHSMKFPEMTEIKLTDLNTHPINLENHKGKTIFINFWATWCKPCVEEMASIEKTQILMNDKEIVFFMASSEGIEEIKAFSQSHHYQFNYVHLENGEALNIQALPTTFIINPKGKIVFSEMGSRNWDEPTNINLIKSITTQHD